MAQRSNGAVIVLGQCRIRKDLGEKVKMLLEDPVKPGRIEYGSLKKYLEMLIAKDLRERQAISDELLEEILKDV